MADNNQQAQMPISKVYEIIGQLYLENNLLMEQGTKIGKELSEVRAHNSVLQKQLDMLQDKDNGNGSSQEE